MSVLGSTASRSPASHAEWLGARAALAGRRRGRIAAGAAAAFVVIVLALLLSPQLGARGLWGVSQELMAAPPGAMIGAATVLAGIAGFSISLIHEISRPTIATAHEAERATGAPVLAVVRDDGQAASAQSIDPFRMLFLGLTATGARVRAVTISGDHRGVTATVAGRLAHAAATDDRATLVVDADAEGSSVAGYYIEPPEPGFTDAFAGVRLWREVARPVGANAELSIDVIPGGSIRRDGSDDANSGAAREEFGRFRSEYDLCILVAPTEAAARRLVAVIERPLVLLCAEAGRTSLSRLRADATRLREMGADLHGVVLWDARPPQLVRRKELMARELSLDRRVELGRRP